MKFGDLNPLSTVVELIKLLEKRKSVSQNTPLSEQKID